MPTRKTLIWKKPDTSPGLIFSVYPITIISFIQAWWYMISFIPALLKKNQNKNRLIPDSYRLISSQLHQSNLRKLGHHRRTVLKQMSAAKKPIVQKKIFSSSGIGGFKEFEPWGKNVEFLTNGPFLHLFFYTNVLSMFERMEWLFQNLPGPHGTLRQIEANSQSLPSSNCWYI